MAKFRQMGSSIFFFFLIIISLCSARKEAFSSTGLVQMECLKVPPLEFADAAKTVVDAIQKAVAIVSKFDKKVGKSRVSNAILDCVDLLDSAAEELSWIISASQNPNGKDNSTGDVGSDLRTWISAALSNQDTCLDGFEGTNGIIKKIVAGGLSRVGTTVRNLLTMVHSPPSKPKPKPIKAHTMTKAHSGFSKFPSWVKPGDRKLLQTDNITVADAVVAADGTGNFTTISDAVLAAPDYSTKRFVIHVKRGVYEENVEIKKKKWNIMIVGDGIDATVITGNRSFIDGWTTFRSATFAVSGRGFIGRDITFQNTAGPEKHQAVAIRSDTDLGVFYRCAMRGYQDTLYAHSMRQFFRECIITGTVDFIFGDATAVFQNCQIKAKQGLPNQKNSITAQGRKDPNEPTGFTIQFSNIAADTDLLPNSNTTATYLGRPWKLYSRTVFMQNYMSDAINPEGWLEWNGNFALDTLYYGEYMNSGPGASLDRRVKWPGYHVLNTPAEANNFTVSQLIQGNLWLPSTGITFIAGLVS
ncbi:Invertase/pectin methylesterase inhibitor domain superfamily [Arabidopsis thaliana x Arabidopsis arenosa]|uniref:Pectinesterase n=1 Tax=Arabidopsis thaliana x Arabidopsis arenosa TaxID=1240361 RepID=A0A8T1ZMR9_9BRAS|nr:Invertase/pectin methylesterase inhibitor domain superfamily [Arabidopsis thaliana x Arabidopsis arenosa]